MARPDAAVQPLARACPTHTAGLQAGDTRLQHRVRRLDVITLWHFTDPISDARRVTVCFEPGLHRALKLRAASSDRSVSEMVNDAVRAGLAEDAEDLETFEEPANEPENAFEDFVKSLKRSGKL